MNRRGGDGWSVTGGGIEGRQGRDKKTMGYEKERYKRKSNGSRNREKKREEIS